VLEAGFRLKVHLEDRGLLTAELQLPVDPPRFHRATLGSVIRRSADARLIYENRPNLNVIYEDALLTTNARGERGRLHPLDRRPGTVRVVGIGDSFMFGQGVSDDQTYLSRLEAQLRRVEAVNLAVPGYNTVMEVAALEKHGLAYQPDVVLIEFVSNDLNLPNFLWTSRDVFALDRSFLASFVRERLRRRKSLSHRRPVEDENLVAAPTEENPNVFLGTSDRVPPEYADMVGWDAYEKAMTRLTELSREHDFKVMVMTWNIIPEEAKVRQLARRLGLNVFNLGPQIETWTRDHGYPRLMSSPLVQGPLDPHPSAVGHEQIAGWLAAYLRLHDLLTPRVAGPRPHVGHHGAATAIAPSPSPPS